MVYNLGQLKRVTKGSLGGKFVLSSTPIKTKYILPKIKLRLPPKKEALLKQHAKYHTKRHMEYMRQIMVMGLSFKEAHQRAAQFIGK